VRLALGHEPLTEVATPEKDVLAVVAPRVARTSVSQARTWFLGKSARSRLGWLARSQFTRLARPCR